MQPDNGRANLLTRLGRWTYSLQSALVLLVNNAFERAIFRKVDAVVPAAAPQPVPSFVLAVTAVAVAVLLRAALGDWIVETQFVTFFPAVIVAALFGGALSGFIAVALSAVAFWLFFSGSTPLLNGSDLTVVATFVILSSLLVLPICALRVALAQARDLQRSLEVRVHERTVEVELAHEKLQDLTRNLETLVEQRTGELKRSRDLLGSVIDGMPDAVFLYEGSEDELRFAYVNAAGARLLGSSRDDVLGKLDVEFVSPKHASENRRVLSSSQPLEVNERLLKGQNSVRCVEVRKFPFRSNGKNKAALLTIIRDVTEIRNLEDSLRQKHRIDALGQLTGGIAHDFNNLLAIAIGNLDLLEAKQASPEEARELLDDARNACLRGAELTGRLLAFARKQTLEPLATSVNDLIADYSKLLSRLLGADIHLQLKLGERLCDAIVDRAQLEAAITNLATNARDAMPKGGKLTISTQNETLDTSYTDKHPGLSPGDYVAIEVSDTGCGMTSEVQEKAVEPFFTTKAEGHGTGLGLSMVFGFAKQSGGHVRIYSEPDEGTTVTLLLPRATIQQTAAVTNESAPDDENSGETILVVDDNAGLRRVTVKQLASLGYTVLEAEDGPMALRILKDDKSVDLLLTDIIMPGGLSGADLGREAHQLRPGLKIIYMSGFPEVAFGDRADLDPDIVLLRKPFRKVDLGKNIRDVLGRS